MTDKNRILRVHNHSGYPASEMYISDMDSSLTKKVSMPLSSEITISYPYRESYSYVFNFTMDGKKMACGFMSEGFNFHIVNALNKFEKYEIITSPISETSTYFTSYKMYPKTYRTVTVSEILKLQNEKSTMIAVNNDIDLSHMTEFSEKDFNTKKLPTYHQQPPPKKSSSGMWVWLLVFITIFFIIAIIIGLVVSQSQK